MEKGVGSVLREIWRIDAVKDHVAVALGLYFLLVFLRLSLQTQFAFSYVTEIS